MKRALLIALFLTTALHAQTSHPAKPDSELYRTIVKLDAELFGAFNRCDLEKFAAFFPDDVEFYHDVDGLSVGRKGLVQSLRENVCGKFTRELLPATLKVYPMKDGALEIGYHRFHHPDDKGLEGVGEGQFIHLWVKGKDGTWKVARVISFDHHGAGK